MKSLSLALRHEAYKLSESLQLRFAVECITYGAVGEGIVELFALLKRYGMDLTGDAGHNIVTATAGAIAPSGNRKHIVAPHSSPP